MKLLNSKASKFICAIFFSALTVTTIIIPPAVSAAETSINWDKLKYDVAELISVRTGFKNILRIGCYNLLKLFCKLIDMFDSAIDDLININLYTLIKTQFNITTIVYPIAWALVCLALIFAAIMLILKADKIRLSDFYRSLFTSLLLLIALPTLVSVFSSLKTSGVKDVKNSFSNTITYDDDTTVTGAKLGETLLANYIYSVDLSLQNNKIVSYSDCANYTDNPASVYQLGINDTLDTSVYNKKTESITPPVSAQKKYENLDLIDKLSLLDEEFSRTTSSTGARTTLVSIYETWSAKDDRYVLYTDGKVYAKTGGSVQGASAIWCRYAPYDDFTSYEPFSQVFEGDIIYTDSKNTQEVKEEVPYFSDFSRIDETNWRNFYVNKADAEKDIRWNSYWEYHRTNAINYQKLVLAQMASYFNSILTSSLPEEYQSTFTVSWVNNNIMSASSIEDAISNLDSNRVYLENYGRSYSIIEYLNLEENYRIYVNGETDDGGAEFDELFSEEKYNGMDTTDKLGWYIRTFGYPVEALYQWNINFGYGLITIIVTIICLIFAGFKLAGLLYDVLFAQIIAPLVVASDLQGAGRAKQAAQNLISCNICFIVVIFILRLYLWVIVAAQREFSFLVVLFLTLAGVKFVIDGPDLVVKILGIDAGVKSGAATLMGLRSAAQLASGVSRSAKNAATAPARMAKGVASAAGRAKAAKEDIKNENGIGNKARAAMANTSIGQAFRQSANGQRQTNDNFKDDNGANVYGDSMSTQAGAVAGSIANSVAGTVDAIKTEAQDNGGGAGAYAKAVAGNTPIGQAFRKAGNSIDENGGGLKGALKSVNSTAAKSAASSFNNKRAETAGKHNMINSGVNPVSGNDERSIGNNGTVNYAEKTSAARADKAAMTDSSVPINNSVQNSSAAQAGNRSDVNAPGSVVTAPAQNGASSSTTNNTVQNNQSVQNNSTAQVGSQSGSTAPSTVVTAPAQNGISSSTTIVLFYIQAFSPNMCRLIL